MEFNKVHNNLHEEYAVTLDKGFRQSKKNTHYYSFIKRLMDILMALIGLIFVISCFIIILYSNKARNSWTSVFFYKKGLGLMASILK